VKTFRNKYTREVALERLAKEGWVLRRWQAGGDYEDLVRASGEPGLLLVDFALSRFILDKTGDTTKLLSQNNEADGDPTYDAILLSLFEGEVVSA
jgi:hypothetical protein